MLAIFHWEPNAHSGKPILAWARFMNEVSMPAANTLGCARYLAPRLTGAARQRIEGAVAALSPGPRRDGWCRALALGRDGPPRQSFAPGTEYSRWG